MGQSNSNQQNKSSKARMEMPFACPFCNENFKSAEARVAHIGKHDIDAALEEQYISTATAAEHVENYVADFVEPYLFIREYLTQSPRSLNRYGTLSSKGDRYPTLIHPDTLLEGQHLFWYYYGMYEAMAVSMRNLAYCLGIEFPSFPTFDQWVDEAMSEQ